MIKRSIFIGYDAREDDAYRVCVQSIRNHLSEDIPIRPIILQEMRDKGLFWREQEHRGNQLWDVISDAPCSTEFSFTRFLIPHLCAGGLALWMDCDMLVRTDLVELFDMADPTKAVQVVKHEHRPAETVKMDGQAQTEYLRKNWSSVVLWNLDHPAHKQLSLRAINSMTGASLHQFAWLLNEEIGELPPEFNHLVGVQPQNPTAKIAHLTLGVPSMPGYENSEFAEEWLAELQNAH